MQLLVGLFMLVSAWVIKMRLAIKNYIRYKFLNSFFTGLSVGSIFVIYEPLKPSIFSLGGIFLAIGMLVVAKFYEILLNIKRYFIIALFVEIIMLILVAIFLFRPYEYMSALLIYIGYQLTFIFGAYLVRAETLIVRKKRLLSIVDESKQLGYLGGMALSYVFYQLLFFDLNKQEQVYNLHFLLFFIEIVIIYLFLKSFRSRWW